MRQRCVTFDLWETLIFDDPEKDDARGQMRYEGVQKVLSEHGIELAVDHLKRGYEESAPILQTSWDRNEEVSIIDQIRLIVKLAAGRDVTFDHSWMPQLEEAYVDPILDISPKLTSEASSVLEAVKTRGYKVGLISNTGRSPGSALRQLLDRYGVLKFFDATVFSNEVNRRKPDRIIFDRAARFLNAECKEIIHVGDNPEADFWGARNAGMSGLLLEQTLPNSARWPPNSLFALARENWCSTGSAIDPLLRVKSLAEALDRIDSLFARKDD